MTDKLIMTTELAERLKTHLAGAIDEVDEADELYKLLQSLPMVDSEPVAWRRFDDVDIAWHVELTTNDDYDGWEPLYTSPQALTPITADDIQLMAFNDCSDDWNDLKYREIWLEGYVSGAHAVIKHRSEAK